ncbi:hypothetical protein JD844_033622, partial [Phrynosoma platyrhinos]
YAYGNVGFWFQWSSLVLFLAMFFFSYFLFLLVSVQKCDYFYHSTVFAVGESKAASALEPQDIGALLHVPLHSWLILNNTSVETTVEYILPFISGKKTLVYDI